MAPFELKPCPLCRGLAEFEYTPWDEENRTGDDGTGWIECQKCHLTLAGCDRDEAERRWNTRVPNACIEPRSGPEESSNG